MTETTCATPLAVARDRDPRFAPLLHFLIAPGAGRGEALCLKWEDVDFARGRITIRRAVVDDSQGQQHCNGYPLSDPLG